MSDILLKKAQIAESAERYEDMAQLMKEYTEKENYQLQKEQRNLFSVAYKNVIGARRSAWRVVSAQEQKTDDRKEVFKEYRKKIEKELTDTCEEVHGLLENIVKNADANDHEGQVFYLKMAGDYHRYLCEVVEKPKRKDHEKKALDYYKDAAEKSKNLSMTHPIRLGLALNFSVFYYEIMNENEKACEAAKTAFDNAVSELDKIEADSYKDSTLIMQLLRDNLTLWTSSEDGRNDGEGLDDDEEAPQS